MKMKPLRIHIVVIVLVFFGTEASSQILPVQWNARFGGAQGDYLTKLIQTHDGGFILGGYSWSGISGDKTQLNWDTTFATTDFWIVKTDANGNYEWDKRFGGIDFEFPPFDIQQTSDGGFILGGTSYSGISGDKSQSGFGQGDCWIIKLDALGNIQWDRAFGGNDFDALGALQQTMDGGYIIGCTSRTGINGSKTQPGFGDNDYWIVKLDIYGNIQWDKDFGGDKRDDLTSIEQTSDGGFIIGGFSFSDSIGTKTQHNWDFTLNTSDYWIVKTDSNGNFQWDKRFGGDSWEGGINNGKVEARQIANGGYIIGGFSFSDTTGDKTAISNDTISGFKADYWIVKTDANGNKIWDKKFGGTSLEDDFGNISITSDGGYLIAGTSYSQEGGDKSQNNLGTEQAWVVKTDSNGIKEWDRTLLSASGGFDDEAGFAVQTIDGCYAIATFTHAGVGGDKTQTSQGDWDYWFAKLCDSDIVISPPDYPGINLTPGLESGEFWISGNFPSRSRMEVYNMLGQKVKEIYLPDGNQSVQLFFILAQGVYSYRIISSNTILKADKFIISK
jgi:hypothetical protein